MEAVRVATPDGTFTLWFSQRGLARLDFPFASQQTPGQTTDLAHLSPELQSWAQLSMKALAESLAGSQPKVLPPLDWSAATEFQRSVWQALLSIPEGETRTYGQIAAAIQRPRAVRAVGRACGANPIPVVVPCHRVLPKSGGIRRLLQRVGLEAKVAGTRKQGFL